MAAFDRHHRSIRWQWDAQLLPRPVERPEENVLGQTQRDRGLIGRVLVELLLSAVRMVQRGGQPLVRSTAMMTRHISQGSAIVRTPAGKKCAFLNCCL